MCYIVVLMKTLVTVMFFLWYVNNTDSAVDTLIVNVDCLDPSTIDSLTVTYYEDLFAFPPSTKNDKSKEPHTCKTKTSSSTSKSTSTPFNGVNGKVHKGTAANEGKGLSETDLGCRYYTIFS